PPPSLGLSTPTHFLALGNCETALALRLARGYWLGGIKSSRRAESLDAIHPRAAIYRHTLHTARPSSRRTSRRAGTVFVRPAARRDPGGPTKTSAIVSKPAGNTFTTAVCTSAAAVTVLEAHTIFDWRCICVVTARRVGHIG
ncbi:hypothetical protein C8F01DRAFT_1365654, partial [Mycena amicta]